MSGIIIVDSLPVSAAKPLPVRTISPLQVVGATTGMPVAAASVLPVRNAPLATFTVSTQATAVTNASLLSLALLPGATTPALRLVGIFAYNAQTAAIVGVNVQLELRRFATASLGTLVTPVSFDTQNSLDVFVVARTGATVVSEVVTPLRTWFFNVDEILAGASSNQGVASALMQVQPPLSTLQQAPTIRVGEGLHVKCVSTSTTGTVNVSFVFTQE